MRIGTWNLDGRRSDRHAHLLHSVDCDVWLLTEVHPAVTLLGYAAHLTHGEIRPGVRWAGVFCRSSLEPLADPIRQARWHASTARPSSAPSSRGVRRVGHRRGSEQAKASAPARQSPTCAVRWGTPPSWCGAGTGTTSSPDTLTPAVARGETRSSLRWPRGISQRPRVTCEQRGAGRRSTTSPYLPTGPSRVRCVSLRQMAQIGCPTTTCTPWTSTALGAPGPSWLATFPQSGRPAADDAYGHVHPATEQLNLLGCSLWPLGSRLGLLILLGGRPGIRCSVADGDRQDPGSLLRVPDLLRVRTRPRGCRRHDSARAHRSVRHATAQRRGARCNTSTSSSRSAGDAPNRRRASGTVELAHLTPKVRCPQVVVPRGHALMASTALSTIPISRPNLAPALIRYRSQAFGDATSAGVGNGS